MDEVDENEIRSSKIEIKLRRNYSEIQNQTAFKPN